MGRDGASSCTVLLRLEEPRGVDPLAWRRARDELLAVLRAAGVRLLVQEGEAGAEPEVVDLCWVLLGDERPQAGPPAAGLAVLQYPGSAPPRVAGWDELFREAAAPAGNEAPPARLREAAAAWVAGGLPAVGLVGPGEAAGAAVAERLLAGDPLGVALRAAGGTLLRGEAEPPPLPPTGRARPGWPLLPRDWQDLQPRRSFVGRGSELARLERDWLRGRAATALLWGPPGSGRSALAAEAVQRWRDGFEACWGFSGRLCARTPAAWLRALDQRLLLSDREYRERARASGSSRLHPMPRHGEEAGARWERLLDRLVETLGRRLLVLDGIELDAAEEGSPSWRDFLPLLAGRLEGGASRLLVTAGEALDGPGLLSLQLGPLAAPELLPWLRQRRALQELAAEPGGRALLRGLLTEARGHPLLLDLLARLAAERGRLARALLRLQGGPFDPFRPGARIEGSERALGRLLDALLEDLEPAARELLALLASACEAPRLGLLRAAWGQASEARRVERWWSELESVWQEVAAGREGMPDSVRGTGVQARPEAARPDVSGLATALVERGLVALEGTGEDALLVLPDALRGPLRERLGGAEEALRRLARAHGELFDSGAPEPVRLEAGRRALDARVRAGDWAGAGVQAFNLLRATERYEEQAPTVELLRILPSALPRPQRWALLAEFARALWRTGWSAEALASLEEGRAAAAVAGDWAACGELHHLLGDVLRGLGRLEAARSAYLEAVNARLRAGSPELDIWRSDLEARAIELRLGRVEEARPRVEQGLERIRALHDRGEAPDEALAAALEVARRLRAAGGRWEEALSLLDERIALLERQGPPRAELRLERCDLLARLGRFEQAEGEARAALDAARSPGERASAHSALARVRALRGDLAGAEAEERRALSLREAGDLSGQAISHHNLAAYAEGRGDEARAAAHLAASLALQLVSGERDRLEADVGHLAHFVKREAARGGRWTLPRLEELLGREDFQGLAQVLEARRLSPEAVQAGLDELVESVRRRLFGG